MDAELAIHIVALQAVAHAAEDVDWEDYPEVGEGDWHEVYKEIKRIARHPSRFNEAMSLLEQRASEWQENNDE